MPKVCPLCAATYPDRSAFCAADGSTLRTTDVSAELIGSVVADRYLVTDFLGEGGMGRVYRARHVRLPQDAALKVLRREQVTDGAAVARFKREAANASRINHDCVARVFDFGETSDGLLYLAMEYVSGRTLHALLDEVGVLEPRRAAAIVRRIGGALDAAHRLGIIHRDLKPDNVMVGERDPRDGADAIKVVDFGIAKAPADEGGASLTRTGYIVGTPEFMSPEQLLGAPLDLRSDVYALALVAYRCLTGVLPFGTSGPGRGLTARLVDPPRRLQDARPTVRWPAEVEAVFAAGLARDPNDRQASAGEFARQLAGAVERWCTDRPARAPRPHAVPVRTPPVRRAPVTIGVIGVLAVVLLGGGWTLLKRHAGVEPTPASAQIRRAQAALLGGDTTGACGALTTARLTARRGVEHGAATQGATGLPGLIGVTLASCPRATSSRSITARNARPAGRPAAGRAA